MFAATPRNGMIIIMDASERVLYLGRERDPGLQAQEVCGEGCDPRAVADQLANRRPHCTRDTAIVT